MTQHTGVLEHHNTSGTLTRNGTTGISGQLKVYGVNGVLLRSIDQSQTLTFTGPVKRHGQARTETVELKVTGASKVVSTGAGVDITIQVVDVHTHAQQRQIWQNITGH
ncbi:hypothetical protein [Deinococcus soli (ex Cha et al. 2016)]|uniref:hypothetical protein n=1 Tax=Deinococcus soli (ex Cha et al. 2016) TaxID=1309411 RepID=UPI001666571C|nr:hypothetical protein [Deinococcus soli (ex Cha et al. 2016)]GGB69396.1 hypothetical protein GCM10008019_26970 [Deinococcus soli (ex Cha et al. 2016)]